jgi:spoIIIJ-associated protein
MTKEGVEATGRTLEEAIDNALAQLGLSRDQVHIEVISPGRPGILGIGAEEARVRVVPLEAYTPPGEEGPEEGVVVKDPTAPEVAKAVEYLQEILRLLGLRARVSVRAPETAADGRGRASAVLDVAGDEGEDLGILIGRRGSTLAALQHIINVMINRQFGTRVIVTVDVEGYKRRREESLRNLALRMAEKAKQTGRPVTLEPMPPAERRIVHLALVNDPDVVTSSIGNGEARKVIISPRRRPRPSSRS